MLHGLLRQAESLLGCRIYRNSLPRGTDFCFDVVRLFGAENITVAFDVGANIGQTTEEFLKHLPAATIYSFEPAPASFQQLKASVAGQSRVKPIQMAVGDTIGELSMEVTGSSSGNAIKSNGGAGTVQVPVTTIDQFVEQEKLSKIDILKIDVEGYELHALRGATQTLQQHNVGLVYLESAPAASDAHFVPIDKLNDFMFPLGYRFFGVYDQQQHWDGRHDLYYFNVAYISPKLIPNEINAQTYPL